MSEPVIRLAARGDGVTASGEFVVGAAPGDLLEANGVLVPGPHRRQPPCRHFGICGGCQLQHVDDESYADFVVARVVDALQTQGLTPPPMRVPDLSPPQSRRRVSLKALRRGKQVMLGYNEERSHRLVDIRECPIMHPRLFALVQPLRQMLSPMLVERRPAQVQMTLADQGVDLTISGVAAEGLTAAEALTAFAQRNRLARVSVDEGFGAQARWEPEPVTITLSSVAVPLPPGGFLQATEDGERCLVAAAREIVGTSETSVDLFAGLGTFTFALPGKVHAVEGGRDTVLALQAAANAARRPVSSEHRDLFRRPLSAAELARFEAAVLDPPRAGSAEQVAELARSSVQRIACISCNPATFARDAKVLIAGGYAIDWIQPVGQFRWSTHVELAASFRR